MGLDRWRYLIAAGIMLAMLGGPRGSQEAASGAPAAEWFQEVAHVARSLQPGEVVQLRFRSPRSLEKAEVRVFDRTFPFYRDDDGIWRSLVGIDLSTKPGNYVAKIYGWDAQGQYSHSHALDVKSKQFPTRRLTVDEKFVNPPKEALARIRRESKRISEIFAGVTEQRLWRGSFQRPVPGPANSSFGKRSILNGQPRNPHTGTDFDSPAGTPVVAPNAGKVVLADDLYYSGNTVVLDHGQGLYSYFAHLSEIDVEEGAEVSSGQVVGKVGATGRVTGPHLHWTLRLVRTRVDPLSLIEVLESDAASGP